MPVKTPTPPPAPPTVDPGRRPEPAAIAKQRATVDRLAAQYDDMLRSPKRDPKALEELGAQLFTERAKLNTLLKPAK